MKLKVKYKSEKALLGRGEILILSVILIMMSSFSVKAQKEFDDIRGTQHWMQFTDEPNSFYHYFASLAYQNLKNRTDRIDHIHTLNGWIERKEWTRKILDGMIKFPKRSPLNPKITQVIIKKGFRIENLVFESQPGFYVTASLLLPDQRKPQEKLPAIVYCSGHTFEGYRSEGYQRVLLNLVKKRFIVLAFDPIGQGERLQYLDSKTDRSRFKYPSYEHSYAGAQLFINGGELSSYFIWDGIRALDYLCSRKEVDTTRIGIAGRSGGGTQSAFIAAYDQRVKAVASGNYFTNYTRLFQSMGPQDAEQDFSKILVKGIDMADLLIVRAPKPALMITTSRDMFPIQGAIESANEISKVYKAFGREQFFKRVEDDAPHASTKKNREAMYAFFQKFLDNPGDPSDEDLGTLTPKELQVTETGQISTSLQGETVFSLNLKQMNINRKDLVKRRLEGSGYKTEILKFAKQLSGYHKPSEISKPIFLGRIQRVGYSIEKYMTKGEGDYMIPYLLMKPENPNGKAIIYLNPDGKTKESAEGREMEWFVKQGLTVLAPDLIGTGELGPGVYRGDSFIDSVSYNLWFAGIMLDRSIVGVQASDVVRLTNILKCNFSSKTIFALAKEQMSPVLLHAAAFDQDISRVAIIQPYSSYESILRVKNYDPKFIQSTVAGVIGKYDLPDLAAILAPRRLMIYKPLDGEGICSESKDLKNDLALIQRSYQTLSVSNECQFILPESNETLESAFLDWLR